MNFMTTSTPPMNDIIRGQITYVHDKSTLQLLVRAVHAANDEDYGERERVIIDKIDIKGISPEENLRELLIMEEVLIGDVFDLRVIERDQSDSLVCHVFRKFELF